VIPILTPGEASALDAASVARGVPVERLMERAGFAVARAAAAIAGGTYGRRAVVVCGRGNNGGDGLVAARHLVRSGMSVTVLLLGEPAAMSGATAANLRRWYGAEGRTQRHTSARLARELARSDVAVDAIFGTGFRGTAEGPFASAIEALSASVPPVVAVDIPSGVDGSTGAVDGPAVRATATVTFGALKPGVVFAPGAGRTGTVEVADIGFPADLVASDLAWVEAGDAAALVRPREPSAHKRSAGVVLVVAGSRAMPGAAVLATRAAYRAGAGLVTLASVAPALEVAQRSVVEATYVALPETASGSIAGDAWTALEDRFASVDVLAIGPGVSRDEETAGLVRRLVHGSPVPVVLDADGLNAFPHGDGLADRASGAILTPHAGEFARLRDVRPADLAADRVGHARGAAGAFDAVLLLKGPRTIVARPDGMATVNPTGGPSLASGGTGDVLTGTIAAGLAKGLEPHAAAVLGAYAHGLAGDLAGAELGDGTTAHDVVERLPEAFRWLAGVREGDGGIEPEATRRDG
jgi:hydroxyethylthiazole kinase-like uncharacterized protein yjeF